MKLAGDLSPARAGAEVLVAIANGRGTGVLAWGRTAGEVRVEFAAGRPARGTDAQGRPKEERQDLVLVVRAFACALAGNFRFVEQPVAPSPATIDTLGEVLVAVLTAMTEPQLTLVWQARSSLAVVPSPTYETLRDACLHVGAPELRVAAAGERLVDLALSAALPAQRAIAALLFLGGLSTMPAAELAAPAPAAGLFKTPSDPRVRAIIADIEAAHAAVQAQSLYGVLGVAKDAPLEVIRKAYLELAKRWHTDRFAGMALGTATSKVEEIFRRLHEAQRLLTDAEQRKAYDFVLEREAQGLPTDPGVILEAEALFKRAHGLVRRAQAPAALPILEKAVALNKGEPEFWVYLGFALYAAKGKAALAEARGHIRHGLEMRDKMDVAHEFLGRIARVEGDVTEARKQFRRTLELNPKNVEAERELRLISMRGGKTEAQAQSLGELFKRLFKRS